MKMVRTFAYFISLLLLLFFPSVIKGQDTITFPLKIMVGAEILGPARYFADKEVFNIEGFGSVDLNEKRTAVFAAGYLDYNYSQYNYTYQNNGFFARAGLEFNLMAPEKSVGKYWTGIGLSYGLSRFTSETPFYKQDNYWGSVTSSIPASKAWGHFIEVAPGVKAEIFRNFSMGWAISVRALIHTSSGKDLRPVYFPGYGNGTKAVTSGFRYYLIWNIPYKKKTVITKPPPVEEEEDEEVEGETEDTQDNLQNNSGRENSRQQSGDIRR
jgi:hypothetical protein